MKWIALWRNAQCVSSRHRSQASRHHSVCSSSVATPPLSFSLIVLRNVQLGGLLGVSRGLQHGATKLLFTVRCFGQIVAEVTWLETQRGERETGQARSSPLHIPSHTMHNFIITRALLLEDILEVDRVLKNRSNESQSLFGQMNRNDYL